jgi:hypothetical protein
VDNSAGRPRRVRQHLSMTTIPPGLDRLARRQLDVVSRAQLAALGIDRHMIARREASRVWRPLGPRAVVLHRGVLTREQRWWVGVLHGDLREVTGIVRPELPVVALTGLSAAEAGGLAGFETRAVHVAVEHGREVEDLDDPAVRVIVHQTRHLERSEVHPTLRPTRLRLPRAVVESASQVAIERPGRARALIAGAVQQRLVRPQDLRAFATARRTLPGRRLVLETINDAAGGAHSLPELEFLRGLRAAGLPEPARQRKLQHADGTWYLDNDFTAYLVTVEVNGLQHYEQLLREADDFQRAVLQISGRIVVDLSSYAVRHQCEQSMLLIAETLVAHGWQPSPRAVRVLAAYRDRLGWDLGTLQAS